MEDGNGHKSDYRLMTEKDEAGDSCDSCEVCVTSNCQSCGMPMTCPQEHGGGNQESMYCIRCCHPDGSLKDYEEVLTGMVSFMMESRKMDKAAAESAARGFLTTMPAWSAS